MQIAPIILLIHLIFHDIFQLAARAFSVDFEASRKEKNLNKSAQNFHGVQDKDVEKVSTD